MDLAPHLMQFVTIKNLGLKQDLRRAETVQFKAFQEVEDIDIGLERVFIKCIIGREKLPNQSKLWDDFIQEEILEGALGNQFNGEVEHNVALATTKKQQKERPQLDQVLTLSIDGTLFFKIS